MAHKIMQWQQEIIDWEKTASNEELYDSVFDAAQPDDYDGMHTNRGGWKYWYLRTQFKERLADWLKVTK